MGVDIDWPHPSPQLEGVAHATDYAQWICAHQKRPAVVKQPHPLLLAVNRSSRWLKKNSKAISYCSCSIINVSLSLSSSWFAGSISERKAELVLRNKGTIGGFLVRSSLLPDVDYVLSVK